MKKGDIVENIVPITINYDNGRTMTHVPVGTTGSIRRYEGGAFYVHWLYEGAEKVVPACPHELRIFIGDER